MAAEPLIDFDALDLSQVIHPKEEILQYNQQRGTFEMLDGVVHVDHEKNLIVGFKEVRDGDWWAKDHIPGRPLFPGAMMIEAAAQLCTLDLYLRRPDMKDTFVGFGGLNNTRFRQAVVPDCRMYLAARLDRLRSRMFTYYAQALVDRTLVFESDVMGVIV